MPHLRQQLQGSTRQAERLSKRKCLAAISSSSREHLSHGISSLEKVLAPPWEFLVPRSDPFRGACSGRDGTHFPGRWFSMASRKPLARLDDGCQTKTSYRQPSRSAEIASTRRSREILVSRIFESFPRPSSPRLSSCTLHCLSSPLSPRFSRPSRAIPERRCKREFARNSKRRANVKF